MLNTILAAVALMFWSTAYGLYFGRDVRRWWRLRPQRRAEARAARERAIASYHALIRAIPPPPSRAPVPPLAVAMAEPGTAQIVPFPRPDRRR